MKNKALISAILVIALCFSLIAGSTFALFTSENGLNVAITSAKVDVTATILQDSLATTSLGVAQTAGEFANGGTAVFNDSADLVLTNITPGDKATFTIEVKNGSNVDVQYRVKWAVDGELYEALVATADGEKIANTTSQWALWTTDDDKVKTIDVSVELPYAVGNEYQDKAASVSFSVEAVQGNAIFEEVTTGDELAVALAVGGSAKLANNITLSTPITIAKDAISTIDLNGNTITAAKDDGAVIVNNGTLSIVGDGTTDSVITNTTANGSAVVENFGELTIVDANIVGAPIADGNDYPEYAVYSKGGTVTIEEGTTITSDRGALRLENSEAVINGGTFTTTDAASDRTLTFYTIYAKSGSTLNIYGGTFENHYTGVSGASVICPAGASINIYGGDFRDDVDSTDNHNYTANIANYMGYSAPVNVYGGTFDDATILKNVATGYEALLDNATGIYTVAKEGNELQPNSKGEMIVVPEGTDTIVETTEGKSAQDALNEAVKSGEIVYIAEPGVYEFPSALNSTEGVTIVGADGVVFEDTLSGTLNSTTFKNVKIKAGNAQRWAYSKGTLVFEDCTFEATSVYAIHYDGLNNANITYKNCTIIGWVAIGGGAEHITFDGCEIKGNGTYGVIRLYSPGTIKNCTFDVDNVNKNDVYQDGIHAVNCHIDLSNNTNVNGKMNDLYHISGSATLTVDGNKFVANGLYTDGNGKYFVENGAGMSALNSIINTRGVNTVELTDDIDMTGYTWNSLGLDVGMTTFDGKGHTISNMTINGNAMFSRMAGGRTITIKDVVFDHAKADTTSKNTALIVGQTYNNLFLDNVDVKNSSFSGETKVAVLVGTIFNESSSTVTLTIQNCDISNCTVTGTPENADEERLAGLVAWVADGYSNEAIVLSNNTMDHVTIISNSTSAEHHAIIYISDVSAASRYGVYHDTDADVTVTNCTFVSNNY